MSALEDLVDHMRKAPANVRYADLCRVCDHYFGKAWQALKAIDKMKDSHEDIKE